jgi:hypothetical protein
MFDLYGDMLLTHTVVGRVIKAFKVEYFRTLKCVTPAAVCMNVVNMLKEETSSLTYWYVISCTVI